MGAVTPGETLGTLYNIHVGSNKTKQHTHAQRERERETDRQTDAGTAPGDRRCVSPYAGVRQRQCPQSALLGDNECFIRRRCPQSALLGDNVTGGVYRPMWASLSQVSGPVLGTVFLMCEGQFHAPGHARTHIRTHMRTHVR